MPQASMRVEGAWDVGLEVVIDFWWSECPSFSSMR
jgi:hypothetical protein